MNDMCNEHGHDRAARPVDIQESCSNPFSTRRVRPGSLPFVFPAGVDADAARGPTARANNWRGEIIGPHGSGKSTLLATLIPYLVAAGREPLLVTLHDGERSLAAHRAALAAAEPRSIVIIDGYEQLAFWNKTRLRWRCRRRNHGLIVTAHQSMGFPHLATTSIDAPTAAAVFRLLVPTPGPVTSDDAAACARGASRRLARDVVRSVRSVRNAPAAQGLTVLTVRFRPAIRVSFSIGCRLFLRISAGIFYLLDGFRR